MDARALDADGCRDIPKAQGGVSIGLHHPSGDGEDGLAGVSVHQTSDSFTYRLIGVDDPNCKPHYLSIHR
jgi:hypothetical protein